MPSAPGALRFLKKASAYLIESAVSMFLSTKHSKRTGLCTTVWGLVIRDGLREVRKTLALTFAMIVKFPSGSLIAIAVTLFSLATGLFSLAAAGVEAMLSQNFPKLFLLASQIFCCRMLG